MLGDNSEKSKNPLKKAMRRRNAKAVAFSAPTYIEASDVEYSTDEEADEGGFFIDDEETAAAAAAAGDADDAHEAQDEDIVVEPLRPKPKETEEPENVQESQESERHSPETQQSNEEFLDAEGKQSLSFFIKGYQGLADSLADGTISRSRNGTVRNTDSFFKDDTAEPKKISLTPNLLRDENAASNELMKEVSSCIQLW